MADKPQPEVKAEPHSDTVLLGHIRQAVRDHHWALDLRQNGNLAQTQAFGKIQDLLGMPWKQGEEEARRRRGEHAVKDPNASL